MKTQPNASTKKLLYCIILDFIGTLSFTIPFLGEFSDLVWAPIAVIFYRKLFPGVAGLFGAGAVFLEELLPFSDFIPTFTLSWIVQNLFSFKSSKRLTDNNVISKV